MKPVNKVVSLAVCLLLYVSASQGETPKGHKITFQISNASGKAVRIGSFYGKEILYLDTFALDQMGNGILEGKEKLPEGLYLMQFEDRTLDFLVSEQQFSIAADFSNLDYTAVAHRSTENKIYFQYKQFMIRQKAKNDSLKRVVSLNPQNETAKNLLKTVSAEVFHYRMSLLKQHPNRLASKVIKAGLEVKISKQLSKEKSDSTQNQRLAKNRLFDNIDLKDQRLIRTPYLEESIVRYVKWTPIHPDSLAKSCDEVLLKVSINPMVRRFALKSLMGQFEKNDQPWMDVLYTYLGKKYVLPDSATWPDKMEFLTIKATIKRFDPLLTGKLAPPIDFMDTLGKQIPLYSVKANYTILYFWDADCEHCQKVTPQLWQLYSKVRAQGVEVYAVTIQQVYYSWQEYIRKHKLTWINVWDPVNIQKTYNTYQIGSTPSIYLLDKDKRILCKNIELKELEMYLGLLTDGVK